MIKNRIERSSILLTGVFLCYIKYMNSNSLLNTFMLQTDVYIILPTTCIRAY